MNSRRPRAFTLVELLVVVMIISLLVGILAPTVGRVLEGARRASCRNNVQQIAHGCKMYALEARMHRGAVPQRLPSLTVTTGNWYNAASGQKGSLWLLVPNNYASRGALVCPSMPGYKAAAESATAFTDTSCSYSYITMVERTLSLADQNLYTDLVIIGDKNPRFASGSSSPSGPVQANSLAHVGRNGLGEGQNVATLGEAARWLEQAKVVTGGSIDGSVPGNKNDWIYASNAPAGDSAGKAANLADVLLID